MSALPRQKSEKSPWALNHLRRLLFLALAVSRSRRRAGIVGHRFRVTTVFMVMMCRIRLVRGLARRRFGLRTGFTVIVARFSSQVRSGFRGVSDRFRTIVRWCDKQFVGIVGDTGRFPWKTT